MRTSIGILDDGAYEVSAYRTDGTGYGQWTPLRAFASQGDAQELPSNPSSGANREKPGEKASTGTREYVAMLKTQIDDFDKRRFDSALWARVLLLLFNF